MANFFYHIHCDQFQKKFILIG